MYFLPLVCAVEACRWRVGRRHCIAIHSSVDAACWDGVAGCLNKVFGLCKYFCERGILSGEAKSKRYFLGQTTIIMTKQNKVETVAVTKPHPLKGIINSNDDPMACAVCADLLDFASDYGFVRLECCGKWTCPECDERGTDIRRKGCSFCSWRPSDLNSQTEYLAVMKRAAKKGHAWGQHQLGDAYFRGTDVVAKQSHPDAFRWLTKSAKRGHPMSHMHLGVMLMEGNGCTIDFEKARHHLETALSLVDDLTENSQHFLTKLAILYTEERSSSSMSEAKSILLPLAKDRMYVAAQFHLGRILAMEGDPHAAYSWFSSAAFMSRQVGIMSAGAVFAFLAAKTIGQLAQVRLWSRFAAAAWEKGLRDPHSNLVNADRSTNLKFIAALADTQKMLRSARDICGGCGAEFEGKERKFCRGCRTYCYCSRDCQKMHWNRKHDGHREDCKAATELKQNMKEAKKVLGW